MSIKNTDIPLVLSFLMACGVSFYSMVTGSPFLYPEIALALLIIFSLSIFLKIKTQHHYNRDIQNLFSLNVTQASLVKGNSEVTVEVPNLKIGDRVRVKPFEAIPCDGIIISGTTRVDESKVTGEKSPLLKSKGDYALGGSLNQDGAIVMEITRDPKEHCLTKMIEHLRQSLSVKSPLQVRLNKIMFFLIPVYLLLVAGIFYLQMKVNLHQAITTAIALLAFASFGSFLTTIPQVLLIGLGKLLKQGIVLRSPQVLRKLKNIDHLFFDKTGTLSQGDFVFSQFYMENRVDQETLLSTFFSLEALSSHPLAKGMETHPWYLEIPKHEVKNFKAHPGLGLAGAICERGKPERFAAIGNLRFLRRFQMQISPALREKVENLELMGETTVLCGWGREILGVMSFSDTLRPDIHSMLAQLQKLKVTPVLVTGDHEEMISHLSQTKGLNKIYMRCLPEEKTKKIKKHQEEGHKVGYVGAPDDDPQILSSADVSLILNASTNPFNITADILLFSNKLVTISEMIAFSRKINSTIRSTLILGTLYHLIGIPLILLGFITPLVAVAAMGFSKILFTAFPLRLSRSHL